MIIDNGNTIAYIHKNKDILTLNTLYNIGNDGDLTGIIEIDTNIFMERY